MSLKHLWVLSAFVGAVVVVSCSGKNNTSGFGEGDGSDGGNGEGGQFAGGDGAPSGDLGCSGDLQNVIIQSTGAVVEACPPDQGCSAGACIPACDAAKASHGTVGCDFMVPTPSFQPAILPPCFAIFLANNWPKPMNITVSRGGTNYDATQFGRIATAGQPESAWPTVSSSGVTQGQVAVLFMSSDPNSANNTPLTCPVPDAINAGTAVAGPGGIAAGSAATGIGKAFHISTDVPVSAYDILPYGGAKSYLPSAELLLPTTAWGTNYYGVVPPRGNGASTGDPAPQWGQIVAATDGTTVQVLANVALPSGTGVVAAPSGQTTTYSLNAGDYIQWQDSMEMSGTVISANNPVAFVGGLGYDCYTSKTSSGGGCDSAHQEIPPVSALGSSYVAAPFATRRKDLQPESIPYRILAAVDGTALTFDPPVTGAPATLSAGELGSFESTTAFLVSSQDANHPFYVGQVMPGCEVTSGSRPGDAQGCLGDEEFVNVLPPAQFLDKYVFFTDPTYATTNLVFTRSSLGGGFQDVNLDCAGTLTGWQPVDSADTFEVTNIDLIRAMQPNGSCGNGPHVASSHGPFGLTVWGLDSYSSYAYPAGGNVATINTVVVPAVK